MHGCWVQYLNEDLDISALFTHMCDSLLKKKPDDPIEEMIRVLEQVKLNVSTQRTRNGVVSSLFGRFALRRTGCQPALS